VEHPTTIAVDLAKSVFEVSLSREPGRVCQRKRLTRCQFANLLANEPASTVLLEACGSSHYWARQRPRARCDRLGSAARRSDPHPGPVGRSFTTVSTSSLTRSPFNRSEVSIPTKQTIGSA